jgi:TldD protein
MNLNLSDINSLLSEKRRSGAEFVEVFAEHKATTSIRLEDNKIEHVRYGIDCGAGIRTLTGEKTSYATTNEIDSPSFFPETASPEKDAMVSLNEKIKTLHRANDTARNISDKIRQVTVNLIETVQRIYVQNSEGIACPDFRRRTRFAIQVIAAEGDVIQTGFEAPGCLGGFLDVFSRHSAEVLAVMAAERAVKMLRAPHAPAGEMRVVLASEAGGTMIHEACGHSLEADFIHKKTSVFTDQLGKQVASPLVTVVDDATLAGNFGSLAIDDEGTPAQRTVLIENGILKAFLSDRLTARLLGIPASGNGRRESFRNRPVPRMTNTFITPGQEDPAEIVKSVNHGLLVKRMGGGQVDVTTGDFVFEVSEGYLIENGQIGSPVRGATLIGNGPKVLQIIDRVGSDLSFQEGVCGKYDHVPVSDAQPTIHIPRIVVGGR